MLPQRVWCSDLPTPPSRARTLWGRGRALRYDRGLHVTVVAHEVLHHLEQFRERLYTVDEILRGDLATAYDVESFTNVGRRVVEARLAGDFGIVQKLRVQADAAIAR